MVSTRRARAECSSGSPTLSQCLSVAKSTECRCLSRTPFLHVRSLLVDRADAQVAGAAARRSRRVRGRAAALAGHQAQQLQLVVGRLQWRARDARQTLRGCAAASGAVRADRYKTPILALPRHHHSRKPLSHLAAAHAS